MPVIIRIPFYGDEIKAIVDDDGEQWVCVLPICKALGIDCSTRFMAPRNGPTLFSFLKATTYFALDQGCRVVRLDDLTEWLQSIRMESVASITKLNAYQSDCTNAVRLHFKRRAARAPHFDMAQAFDRAIAAALAPLIDRLAAIEARLGIENTTKEGE